MPADLTLDGPPRTRQLGPAIFLTGMALAAGTLLFLGATGRATSAVARVAFVAAVISGAATAWRMRRYRTPNVTPSSNSPMPTSSAHRDVAIFERLSEPVLVVDRSGKILHATSTVSRTIGYPPSALRGLFLKSLLHEDDAPTVEAALDAAAEGRDAATPPHWRVRCADGAWLNAEALITSLLDEPAIGGIAVALRDVRMRVSPSALPDEESLRDPLTGLPGRALFRDRVEHALTRAHRQQLPLAVLLLDFDDFRSGGMRASYEQLELLIAAASTRLATCLRGSDSAARLEGSRFGILLEDMSDESNFVQVAERIGRVFAAPLTIEGKEFTGAASMGIASAVPEDAPDDLIRHADAALRSAKRRGRGACELFDPRVHSGALGHRNLEDDIRRGLERGEFSMVYQPIVILRSRRIAGVEALVRWRHPHRGIIPSAAFMPVAEDTGLIVPMGRWAIAEACRQLGLWQATLGPDRALTVTVNVTPRQLLQATFVNDVAKAIADSGIEPHRLVLEITEGALARSMTDALVRLREVRVLGVRLAIDDYGSRSATLGDPSDIPVDILKIDRAFISQIAKRPEEHAATRAIVALGKLKQLRTVAEGVEREDQLVELLRFKCEYGQGALFSEPLPAQGMLELLLRD